MSYNELMIYKGAIKGELTWGEASHLCNTSIKCGSRCPYRIFFNDMEMMCYIATLEETQRAIEFNYSLPLIDVVDLV